jgi:hypothetical protein
MRMVLHFCNITIETHDVFDSCTKMGHDITRFNLALGFTCDCYKT